MHHLKLSSHPPYKVGLLLPQERNEDLLVTELGRGDSEGLASLLLTLSRPIQQAEFVFRCSQHPQISPECLLLSLHSQSLCQQLPSDSACLEKIPELVAVRIRRLPKEKPCLRGLWRD